VEKLRGGIGQLFAANGITVFDGMGSFEARNRIRIAGKDTTTIEARGTIVATGSESVVPGFLPRHERVQESRAFLDRGDLPKRLLVLGGGVIGCEFACMAAQLGADVTVVELLEDILLMVDKDIRRELRRHMEKELGIRVLAGQPLEDVKATKTEVTGKAGDEALSADVLLVSIGRRPVTAGLDLGKAGIETDERGYIPVDAHQRTRSATVYAVGDVTGGPQLAHAATAQGIAAAENACGAGKARCSTLVPACIFTSPEIGSVGLSESQAAEQGLNVHTGKFPFSGLGKAMASGETVGFVKWVADADTDQLLGAHAVGAHATELIAEATAAIEAELTVEDLGRTIHCHPTMSEAWMEAAHAVHGTCIHAAPKRRR
jgi:dihydrolipoamide dehydrogenase